MAATAKVGKKVWIPEVPRSRIRELAKRIKPIVSIDHQLYYIKPVDPFRIAYTWDPEPADRATGLTPLCDITTYHSYGYVAFFKPSISEVIAQIPEEHLDKVVAFRITKSPETCDDLNSHCEATDAGYHVATTRLYVQKGSRARSRRH